ncbi:carbon-nitrogen hydrolase family protein [Selenomonadales bacterium OttesenSCG-928-I06]|nr:carbon-nitrogen hydrolase family protein [Selenomonadales bacterium OttesenSCG-928-I06]
MKLVRFAQLQLSVVEEKMKNVEIAVSFLDVVSRENVDIVTLPEMFCCPYQKENFPVYAEPEGGEVWTACSELAKKYKVYLSAGSIPELDDKGQVFNTAYVFDRAGQQIGKHRKMHLFDINVRGGQQFKESDMLTAGNSVTVFDTEFGKMGLCVCYDFRFPELARLMVLQGAEIILVPGAFNMTTGPIHWELLFRSRAVDNQVFTFGTAPARDGCSQYVSWGHSIAVDPWGNVISHMDEKEGYTITEIDLEIVSRIRNQLPLLNQRRTDIYTLTEIK